MMVGQGSTPPPADSTSVPVKDGSVAPVAYQRSTLAQLGATMKRQFIQKRRMPCSCCLEIFLPVLFITGLVFAAQAADIIDNPAMNYVKYNESVVSLDPTIAAVGSMCYVGNETAPEIMNNPKLSNIIKPCNTSALPGYTCDVETGPSKFGLPVNGLCVPKGFFFLVPGLFRNFEQIRRIPDLDTLILMQWGYRIAGYNEDFGRVSGTSIIGSLYATGRVWFIPDSPETRAIGNYLVSNTSLFKYIGPTYGDNYDQVIDNITSVGGEGKTWAVIELDDQDQDNFVITLNMNRSAIAWTNRIRERFAGGLGQERYATYYSSGFITLQSALNNYYAKEVAGVPASEFAEIYDAVPMPTSAYKDSVFLSLAGQLSPLVLVLSFLYSVSQIAKRLVEEKEQRLREGMFIMGLGKVSFYAGWILTYTLQAFLTCLIITILLKRNIMVGSDPTIIFLVYFLFALSSITLASFFSTLFSKSRVSGIVTPLIYVAMVIPTFVISPDDNPGAATAMSILSPSAFSVATNLLFQYELGQGMGWNDVGSSLDPVNMATAMTFLAIDCALYLLLTLYLDAVLPSEWGTRKHPLFFIGLGRKPVINQSVGSDTAANYTGTPLAEMLPQDANNFIQRGVQEQVDQYPSDIKESSVHINNLRKEFPTDKGQPPKIAVDNFQMRLFPNHITALLGHNGAGKTTTINMLTGMLEISAGDCNVYGNSVFENVDAARHEIGFCPQHNILWDNLTCMEHLEYFAALKGVPSKDRTAQAKHFLEQVDLLTHTDVFASKLSGGQKRKLSVAIAFIGGSRLILLDEPTAGMDVAARRHTWELLKKMSIGRTTVLTTHFMDEADLLGHRVAIMSKGKLHSYGSPMFLKSRLGTGYTLKVTAKSSIGDPAPITNMITRICPAAAMKECKGQEAAYDLPMSAAHQFPAVLKELEVSGPSAANVAGVSMSVSTLEDVFVKISHEEELGDAAANQKKSDKDTAAVDLVDPEVRQALNDCFGPTAPSRKDLETSFGRQLPALLKKRFANSRRDGRTICLQVFTPLICITLAMMLSLAGPPATPRVELTREMYGAEPPQMISLGNCPTLEEYFSDNMKKDVPMDASYVANTMNFSSYLLDTAKTTGDYERYVSIFCNDKNWTDFMPDAPPLVTMPKHTTFFTNASAIHSLPQIINEYYQAQVRKHKNNMNSKMTIATHPLPFTIREEGAIDSFVTLIVGFFILIPFTFIPSTFVSFIVKERECKAKHQQLVSGVSITAYWISNFLFDLLSFVVTEIISILIFVIFQRDEYIGSGENIGCVILLFTLYGLSAIAASYAFSFAFATHGTAQNIVLLLNFIFGFVLVITAYIFKIIDSTKDVAEVLVYFFRIVPSYCLGEGILALAQSPLQKQLGQEVNLFDMDSTGWAMLYMALNFLLFAGITAFLDSPARAKKRQQIFYDKSKVPEPVEGEDIDVQRERAAVEKKSRKGDVVTVTHLRKEYPGGKVAVKNLSFGVTQGEVFGFLGTNGAGKTTTMSVLTGEHFPTNGFAEVGGYDVIEQSGEARQLIGYCPQFDSVLDLLNAEEHLRMYAAIRGIPKNKEEVIINGLITACGLKPHRLVPSKSLSGGNKRKLSVAIALMGNPSVIILDEPSAGMDPVARRDMWEVIVHIATHSSVILTTHHLEEIEVLAHRVGIMVDGGLKCLGSLDHLKRKFGAGFELSVRVQPSPANEFLGAAKIFIQSKFPRADLVEEHGGKLAYNMPHSGSSLAAVFQIMLDAKADPKVGIEDFTVQQTSLEQVFMRISQAAAAREDDELVAENNKTSDEVGTRGSQAARRSTFNFLDANQQHDGSELAKPLNPILTSTTVGGAAAGGGDFSSNNTFNEDSPLLLAESKPKLRVPAQGGNGGGHQRTESL